MKNHVRFEYVLWKMSDVVSFPLFGFIVVIKLIKYDLKSHWNILFFDKKVYDVDLNKSYGKMFDFVLFTLFGFMLVIKLRNVYF